MVIRSGPFRGYRHSWTGQIIRVHFSPPRACARLRWLQRFDRWTGPCIKQWKIMKQLGTFLVTVAKVSFPACVRCRDRDAVVNTIEGLISEQI